MGRRRNDEDDLGYPPGFPEALGRTIKVFRTDRGLERRDLAELVGISYSYLTEIENGNKPPSSSVLGPIAAALGLRMSELIEAAETRMEAQAETAAPLLSAQAWAREFSPRPKTAEAATPAQGHSVPPAKHPSDMRFLMQSSLRDSDRDRRAAMAELERLLQTMAPDDIERLLDFARRLSR